MEKKELFDTIEGIYWYDIGFIDAGISDPDRRKILEKMLEQDDSMMILTEYVKQYYFSEKDIPNNETLAEVKSFMDWLSDSFGYDI